MRLGATTKTRTQKQSHAQLRMAGSEPADITAGGSKYQMVKPSWSQEASGDVERLWQKARAPLPTPTRSLQSHSRAQPSIVHDFVATSTKGTRSMQSSAPRSSQSGNETFQASLQESSPNGPTA